MVSSRWKTTRMYVVRANGLTMSALPTKERENPTVNTWLMEICGRENRKGKITVVNV